MLRMQQKLQMQAQQWYAQQMQAIQEQMAQIQQQQQQMQAQQAQQLAQVQMQQLQHKLRQGRQIQQELQQWQARIQMTQHGYWRMPHLQQGPRQGMAGTPGDRHPDRLASINDKGMLLHAMGKLEEARPLLEEELEGCVSLHGMAHKEMRDSAMHLARLLHNSDQRDEAGALAAKYGVSLQTGDWAQSTNVSGETYWWRTNEEKWNGIEIALTEPDELWAQRVFV